MQSAVCTSNEDELLLAGGMRSAVCEKAACKWCSGSLTELVTISFRRSSVYWPTGRLLFVFTRGDSSAIKCLSAISCTCLVCRLNHVLSQRLCAVNYRVFSSLCMLLFNVASQQRLSTCSLKQQVTADETSRCQQGGLQYVRTRESSEKRSFTTDSSNIGDMPSDPTIGDVPCAIGGCGWLTTCRPRLGLHMM